MPKSVNKLQPPTILNATITPSTLPYGGGNVTINATVQNATQVQLDVVAPGQFVAVTLPKTAIPVKTSRSFTIRTTSAQGRVATAPLSVSVALAPSPPALAISTSSLPAAQVGAAYYAQIVASGGTSPLALSIASGSLPSGLSLSQSGAIAGTPTTQGWFAFSAKVADAAGVSTAKPLSIDVAAVTNKPPVWATIPPINFTQGAPASINVGQYASDPENNPLTLTVETPLPAGISFVPPMLKYDGIGAPITVNATFGADDAVVAQQPPPASPPTSTPPPDPAPTPNPSAIWSLELTDFASLTAQAGYHLNGWDGSIAWAFNPEFLVDPQGIKYLRFSNDPNQLDTTHGEGTRLITWFMPLAEKSPGVGQVGSGRESVETSYLLWIEVDVAAAFNELGMKLPGPSYEDGFSPDVETLSWRMWHAPPSTNGTYEFQDYLYDATLGSGWPRDRVPRWGVLEPNRWNAIKVQGRLNTPGIADGYGAVFLNDVKVFESTTMKFRTKPETVWRSLHVNVYHGGMTAPKGIMHYRIAKLAVRGFP